MNDFIDWLRIFLAQRDLRKPNGEMLFTYRVTRTEYIELRGMFADKLRRLAGSPWEMPTHSECACFVLYSAEWWRREYSGGAWRWMTILESFGQPFDLDVPNRTLAVQRGIRAWGQQISDNGKKFLGAIVAQGGLPFELIARGDGAIARLLTSGLRQAQLFNWDADRLEAHFEAHANELVLHLREDAIYRLLAGVVQTVITLRQRHGLAGCSNPVEVLDRNEPEWRLRFPISVEDKSAEPLLIGLVREAAKEVKPHAIFPLSVTRSLIRSDDGLTFTLGMTVEAPRSFPLVTLASLYNIPDENFPHSFAIELVGKDRLSLGTGRQLLGGETATVMLSVRARRLQGEAATCEKLMVLRGVGSDFHEPVVIPGAEALDDELPWVFAHTNGVVVLIGQGGCRVADEQCWVALPVGAIATPRDGDSSVGVAGRMVDVGQLRTVYEFTGDCRVDISGDVFRIQTRQSVELTEPLVWRGRRAPYVSQPFQVYLGLPRLYRTTPDGQQIPVAAPDLVWCEARRGGAQVTNPKSHRGPVDAWLLKDGQRVRRFRMVVVAQEASIRYLSGSTSREGVIEFHHWGLDAVAAPDDLNAQTTAPATSAAPYTLTLRAADMPPARLLVSVNWPCSALPLRLRLPFPAAGGRFALSGTGRLPNGGLVSLRQLYSLRAQVFDHNPQSPNRYTLEVELQRPTARSQGPRLGFQHPLTIDATGQCELRLMELEADLLSLWCQSDELDSRLSLSVRQGAGLCSQVYLTRYDADLRSVAYGFEVPESSFAQFDPATAAGMKLRAIPLLKPRAVSVGLDQSMSAGVPTGRWITSALPTAEGPWLVYPAADSTLQLRSVLHAGVPLDADQSALCELGKVMSIADPQERLAAMATTIAAMAQDLVHPSWALIAGQHRELVHLPLNTFDYWRAIARDHAACLTAVLTCNTDIPQLMTRMRTELGVVWELTPPLVIDRALQLICTDWAKKLELEPGDALVRQVAETSFRAIGQTDAVFGERVDYAMWRAGFPKAARLQDFVAASQLPSKFLTGLLWAGDNSLLMRYLLRAKSENPIWPSFQLTDEMLQALDNVAPDDAAWLSKEVGRALLWRPDIEAGAIKYRIDASNVPFLAGLLSQFTHSVSIWADSDCIAKIRHIRNFDPFWFETAFRMGVCLAVGVQAKRMAAKPVVTARPVPSTPSPSRVTSMSPSSHDGRG